MRLGKRETLVGEEAAKAKHLERWQGRPLKKDDHHTLI